MNVVKFEKRPNTYNEFRTISPLALDIYDTCVSLIVRGRIDPHELLQTGNLKIAEPREGFVSPKDIKDITNSVNNLKELGLRAPNAYTFLSEIVHPATLSLLGYLQNETIQKHFGLHFLRRDVSLPGDVQGDKSDTTVNSKIAEIFEEAVSIVLRLCRETESIERPLIDLAKKYVRLYTEETRKNNPIVARALCNKLKKHPYDICICMSGQKYKFCCGPHLCSG